MNAPACPACEGTGAEFSPIPYLSPTCRTCQGSGVRRCDCGRDAVLVDETDDAVCERCGVLYGVLANCAGSEACEGPNPMPADALDECGHCDRCADAHADEWWAHAPYDLMRNPPSYVRRGKHWKYLVARMGAG